MLFKKQINRYFLTLIVAFSFIPVVFAQTGIVKGKVVESPSGDPLPGVSVVEINENDRQLNGAVTDANGNYTLKITDVKNRIRFSGIGSKTVVESINSRTVINMQMSNSTKELDEIVISTKKEDKPSVGFLNMNKRDLITSLSTIKSESLDKEPVASLDQMLQGRASGVQVIAESGDPGAGAEVRIRGISDINGSSQPLYVVDGIPIISDASATTGGAARVNPIADINMADVERIDILKDGNAAAMYGSRAANGVILITTKRGKPGVTSINFKYTLGIAQQPNQIPVLDAQQYKSMQLEGMQNAGYINPLNNASIRPYVDDPGFEGYRYYQNNTNWFSGILQTGLASNYNLSVSGGGESARYNFTTSYTDQKGTIIGLGLKQYTGRFNLDYKISDKFKLTTNVYFARTQRAVHYGVSGGTPYQIALLRSPLLPIYDIDANGNRLSSYFSLPGNQNGQDNPIAVVNSTSNYVYGTNLKPNITSDFEVIKDLHFKTTASLDFFGENGVSFLPAQASGVIWNDENFNKLENRDSERRQLVLQSYLAYMKNVKRFKNTFLFGAEYTKASANSFLTNSYAAASEEMRSLGASAANRRLETSLNEDGILRQYFQAQTIFKDKYALNFLFSRDGVSKFGNKNKYGFFPSVGGFWRISEEPFLKNSRVINDLKLRFSYGVTGNANNLGSYDYLSQFSTGNSYTDLVGIAQINPELTRIKWASNLKKNLGMELRMFNRLDVTFELYDYKTIDMLYNLTIPNSAGLYNTDAAKASTIKVNLGDLSNRGIELDLGADIFKPKKSGTFSWRSDFNISKNVNVITRLPGGTLVINGNSNFKGFQSQIKQDDPLGTFYGLVYKGVYATDADAAVRDANGKIVYELDGVTPRMMKIKAENGEIFKGGDAIYEDFNHDGIINDQDKVLIGDAMPDFYGGFTNSFRFKNFTLTTFMNFQLGNDLINGMRLDLEKMNNPNNQAASVLKRWRKQGDVTDVPRAIIYPFNTTGGADDRNYLGSTRWVEDGSYVRLSSVSFGYSLPNNIVKRVHLRGVNMFLTATRLFTWTKYTGADPEVALGSAVGLMGIDNSYNNPRSRGYTFGVNLSL